MKTSLVKYIIVFLISFTATGCLDGFIEEEAIGEGSASIAATLDFAPMSSALTRTRAAGGALKDINSLHVLLYDRNGALINSWELTDYQVSDEDRTDADAENGHKAEAQTKQVTFRLPEEIGFGKYYMYAVANIPDLLTNTAYSEYIRTVGGLKSIPLTWNSEDISANGQMIGCFTNSYAQSADESVTVNTKSAKLHAWLRRAASKVTIAYDGSQLKEGVFIYLQSAQIKDIPHQCYLGKENKVGAIDYTLETPASGEEMQDGEIFYYSEGGDTGNIEYGEGWGHRVMLGAPYFGSHDETAQSLYFYENMQGAGEVMPDKRQDANGDKELDYPGLPHDPEKYPHYRLKDGVPYGTYIEVQAHYISNNSERLGNGHIVYRFMLGQDVLKDYNAKRNCHYKLTLKFKNFANEADWHIEYVQPEMSVVAPEPYYISYLYKHSLMYPIKVSTAGRKIEYMKAEIIENRWAPLNADADVYYTPEDKGTTELWNGFLSLHEIMQPVLTAASNQSNYYAYPCGEREYREFTLPEGVTSKEFTTEHSKSGQDIYRVEKHPTEFSTYNVYIPMYTREKQMIISTGYTGNNPYVAYPRRARVKLTTKFEGVNECLYNEVPIYQVRRIVNPKGIYRSFGNNASFRVVLKQLLNEDATMFTSFRSEGPWKAYVDKRYNGDGITLSVSSDQTELRSDPQYGEVIYGKTGSVIDFNVDFSGASSENRYAIICVKYHNYTCEHLIFVRQGDKPDNVVPNGVKWYAQNMRTSTELASTPLDEGSLFKFGNWDCPIDARDNKNPFEPWINVTPEDFKVYPEDGFTNAATKAKMKWTEITSKGKGSQFGKPLLANARVATFADYWELRQKDNDADRDLEQGYGILYGDDAVQTADYITDAYGYDYEHNSQGRGMRGCFAYDYKTGKNLFFPVGASGYGHRKQSYTASWGDSETLNGVLRYAAARTQLYASPVGRPLFYDLYKRPGACYWFNEQFDKNLGWDINYFTFDFNSLSTGNLIRSGGSDACFVRCVVD